MVIINTEKCTGCAQCVNDCFPRNITIENGKAQPISETCMQCGHCVAICPANAVVIADYDMNDVTDIPPQKFTAEELISFIKFRRSIRQYKERQVAQNLIIQIIEAGRYTATGGNRQGLSFIVVEKEMELFRGLVIENLAEKGREMLAAENTPLPMLNYAQRWIAYEDSYRKNPKEKDAVFFGAPIVVLIAGDNPIDAGLAASNMELVACANGLGVLYSGFIAWGSKDEKTKIKIGVPAEKEVLLALVIGYPDVQYKRSAPRKKADIIWS
jgi:nitroreductase/NAD-dependent dihydropyrimidine dehydrogenase PreA subunit